MLNRGPTLCGAGAECITKDFLSLRITSCKPVVVGQAPRGVDLHHQTRTQTSPPLPCCSLSSTSASKADTSCTDTNQRRLLTDQLPSTTHIEVDGKQVFGDGSTLTSHGLGNAFINHNKQFVKSLRDVQSLDKLAALVGDAKHTLDMQAVTAIGSCLAGLAMPRVSPSTYEVVQPADGHPNTQPISNPQSITAPQLAHSTHLQTNSSRSTTPSPASPYSQPSSTPHFTLYPPSLGPLPSSQPSATPTVPRTSQHPPKPEPLPRLHAFALRVWQPLLLAQLPSSDAAGVSMCLQAAAYLQWPAPALLEPLLQSLEFQLHTCSPHTLSQSLWSLARLGVNPPEAWLRRWTAATRPRLSRFKPRDLSAALWALAKLEWSPPEAWTHAVLSSLRASLPEFHPSTGGGQALATCVWALAALRRTPPPELLDACLAHIEHLACAHAGAQQGGADHASRYTNVAQTYRSGAGEIAGGGASSEVQGGLGSIARDSACLKARSGLEVEGPQVGTAWCGMHGQEGVAKLGGTSSQQGQQERQYLTDSNLQPGSKLQPGSDVQPGKQLQVDSSTQPDSSLQPRNDVQPGKQLQIDGSMQPDSSLQPTMSDFQTATCSRASSSSCGDLVLGPQSLGMLAYALVVFQHRPSTSFANSFVKTTYDCLHMADPQELSLMVMALANWKLRPPSAWMAHFVTVCQPQLQAFTSQGLTLVLDAFTQLGYRPPGSWITKYEAAVARFLPKLRPTATAQALATMGAQGYLPQASLGKRLLPRLLGGSRHVLAKRWFPAILGAATLGLLPPPSPSAKPFPWASQQQQQQQQQPQQQQQYHQQHVRSPAWDKRLLQLVLTQSRDKYAYCRSGNLTQLALVLAIWQGRERQEQQQQYYGAGPGRGIYSEQQQEWQHSSQHESLWEVVEAWLPGFYSALRQKIGLAAPADVAALMHAASYFPPSAPPSSAHTFGRDTQDNNISHKGSQQQTIQGHPDLHCELGQHHPHPEQQHHDGHQNTPQHRQATPHRQPRVPSTDCLHLVLLLLQACVTSLNLYSLDDLLLMMRGATALGCSCKPPEVAIDGGTPHAGQASGVSSSSNSGMGISTSSSEVIRPQANSQGSEFELCAATAPLMHFIGDRIMQLIMELRPPQQSLTELAETASVPQKAPPALNQRFERAGSAGGDALAPVEHAHPGGMAYQLRARALAVLDGYGSSRRGSMQGISQLLHAWGTLIDAGYFSAAQPVKRIRLCVAMYQACETQLPVVVGDSDHLLVKEARALAVFMPIPPGPEWLGGVCCAEEIWHEGAASVIQFPTS